MSDRLEEIKARVEAATPGPWEWDGAERLRRELIRLGYVESAPVEGEE
jgi:hypothetical protein